MAPRLLEFPWNKHSFLKMRLGKIQTLKVLSYFILAITILNVDQSSRDCSCPRSQMVAMFQGSGYHKSCCLIYLQQVYLCLYQLQTCFNNLICVHLNFVKNGPLAFPARSVHCEAIYCLPWNAKGLIYTTSVTSVVCTSSSIFTKPKCSRPAALFGINDLNIVATRIVKGNLLKLHTGLLANLLHGWFNGPFAVAFEIGMPCIPQQRLWGNHQGRWCQLVPTSNFSTLLASPGLWFSKMMSLRLKKMKNSHT